MTKVTGIKRNTLLGVLACVVFVTSFTLHYKKQKITGNGFAVIELFTSEGCSSCPPADEAVAKLLDEHNNNVFVLGFHVDYWDNLGWKDEFSSAAYTARQRQYGSKFGPNAIYTPQAVVNGAVQFVGSDNGKLQANVEDGLKQAAGITIAISAKAADDKTVAVTYKLTSGVQGRLNIALVQLQAQHNVIKGENHGKVLHHVNVVRDFKTITLNPAEGDVNLTLPAGLAVKDCMVIAYTQDDQSLKITGATSSPIQ